MSTELLNPNRTWTIGTGGQLSTVSASTVKGDTISAKTTGGTVTLDSAVKFNGGIDLNGQTISGNNGSLNGFSNIASANIAASTGFTGNLTGNVTGNVTGTVSSIANHTTTNLDEGTNQYFTDARARGAVSVTDAGGDGSLAYNSTTGAITYTGPSASETRAHFSAGTGIAYNATTGEISAPQSLSSGSDVTFNTVTATNGVTGDLTGDVTGTVSSIANHSTTNLSEGTNQYFTSARARGAVSVTDNGGDGSLSYNSTTGIVTYTGPSAAETRAHFAGTTNQVTINNGTLSLPQSIASTSDVTFNSVSANISGNVTGDVTGDVTGTVSSIANHSTTNLSEGTNQYFTSARARGAVSVNDNGGDGSLAYNSTTGIVTYTGPSASETRSHFSAGTGVSVSDGQFSIGQAVSTTSNVTFATVSAAVTGTVSSISNHNTDVLDEGSTNQYFTEARARAAVSVTDAGGDGSLAYNNSTGAITYTGPSASETRSHFSAGTGVSVSDGQFSIGQAVATTDAVEFSSVTANLTGNVTGDVSGKAGTVTSLAGNNTDGLDEGSTNQYFTSARARGTVSVDNAGGDGSLAYNSTTGVVTYTGPSASDTRAHFSAGTGVSVSDGQFSIGQAVDTNSNVTFGSVIVNTEPTQSGHLANKAYVDATAQGLDVKDSVRAATTGNITLSNTQTIDGVSLASGNRVLVKNQTDATENGIYIVVDGGNWTRSNDMDAPSEIKGAFTFVEEGTNNAAAGFVQSGAGTITIGTSNIEFTQFSGAGSVTAGEGLDKTGNTLSVKAAQTQITDVGTLNSLNMGGSIDLNNNNIVSGGSITASTFTGDVTGNVTGTVSSLANHDTDDVAQGVNNKYFSNELARGAVSVTDAGGDGSLAYNSTTGAITYTGPSASDTRAHFSAGTGVSVSDGQFSIGQAVSTTSSVTFAGVSAPVTGNVTGDVTGDVTGTVSSIANHTTTDLDEGTNQYFTDARARGAVSVTDNGGDGSLTYSSATGAISYTGPSASETRAHFTAGTGVSVTDGEFSIGQAVSTSDAVTFAGVTAPLTGNVIGNVTGTVTGDVTGDVTGTVSSIANHSTTNLSEGTNQYFTSARARGAVSVTDAGGDGSLSYNSTTGIVTYTGPSAAETRNHFSAGTGVSITDGEVSVGQDVSTSSNVTFAGVTAPVTGDVTGDVTGNLETATSGHIRVKNSSGYYAGLQASASTSADYTLKLPEDVGGNGQVLKTDGTGNLSWGSGASGVVKQFISKTQHSGSALPSSFTATGAQEQTPTGYSLGITPVSSTSKVFIMFKVGFRCSIEPMQRITFSIYRTSGVSETLVVSDIKQGTGNASGPLNGIYISNFVDEPGVTTECTYQLKYTLESGGVESEENEYKAGIVGGDDCANCLALQEVEGSGASATLLSQSSDAMGIYYNKGTLKLDTNATAVNSGNVSGVSLILGGGYQLPNTSAGLGVTVSTNGNTLSVNGGNVSHGTAYYEHTSGDIDTLSVSNLRNNSQVIILFKNTGSQAIGINGSSSGISGALAAYASDVSVDSNGYVLLTITQLGDALPVLNVVLVA